MNVHVVDVAFHYKRRHRVLHDVSFHLEKGVFCVVVGPSGGGKTTLLQLLAGLLPPTRGQIKTGGMGTELRPAATIVYQYPEKHFFHMTVRDELTFGLRKLGLDEGDQQKRIADCFQALGIDPELLHRSPFALSGGEQRLVALSVALTMRPGMLLLDEPTVGLDGLTRDAVVRAIDEWRKEHGTTVVVASHDIAEWIGYATKTIALLDGTVVFDGETGVFLSRERLFMRLGLAPPPISRLVRQLRSEGFDVFDDPTDFDKVIDSIVDEVDKRRRPTGGSRRGQRLFE